MQLSTPRIPRLEGARPGAGRRSPARRAGYLVPIVLGADGESPRIFRPGSVLTKVTSVVGLRQGADSASRQDLATHPVTIRRGLLDGRYGRLLRHGRIVGHGVGAPGQPWESGAVSLHVHTERCRCAQSVDTVSWILEIAVDEQSIATPRCPDDDEKMPR
jgi:hypothetical protein